MMLFFVELSFSRFPWENMNATHRMEDDIAHFVPVVCSGNLKEEAEGKGSSKGKHKLVWEPSKHTMSNSQTNLEGCHGIHVVMNLSCIS